MQWIIILLVIIVLLLGGWWILAVGIGLLVVAIGAIIAGVTWLFGAIWPFLVLALVAFVVFGLVGIILEAIGVDKRKPAPPADRPLPPFRRPRRDRR